MIIVFIPINDKLVSNALLDDCQFDGFFTVTRYNSREKLNLFHP